MDIRLRCAVCDMPLAFVGCFTTSEDGHHHRYECSGCGTLLIDRGTGRRWIRQGDAR